MVGQFNPNTVGCTKFGTSSKLVGNWIDNLCGLVDLLITSRDIKHSAVLIPPKYKTIHKAEY